VQPSTLDLEEGTGDSGSESYTRTFDSSEVLAEGDSSSSTTIPVRNDEDGQVAINLRRRRVFVESESAKRSRLEL
jgi:hypothetical protein